MLKVFNPSPVQVGSIECLQSAQKLAEEILITSGIKFTAVRAHQAHHG